jgi:hypothetical protein
VEPAAGDSTLIVEKIVVSHVTLASPAWPAVYLALGIRAVGREEVVGLWIEQTEGAKIWLKV